MAAEIIVPALTLTDTLGCIDEIASAKYARRAANSSFDRFLLSGSIGLGLGTPMRARLKTLEIWLDHVASDRLLACSWDAKESSEICRMGVRPMVVLQNAEDERRILRIMSDLPVGAWVYSHPQYSTAVLSAAVLRAARDEGVLPAGAKVSKVNVDEVRALRDAAGPDFALFDGRCRHVAASVAAGATGVVAVPLTVLPEDLPPRESFDALQAVIDRGQAVVDAHVDVAGQARALRRLLLETL